MSLLNIKGILNKNHAQRELLSQNLKKNTSAVVTSSFDVVKNKIQENTLTTSQSLGNNNANPIKGAVDNVFNQYKGTRYLWGGEGKNGIDCSAFTQKVMKGCGVSVPRTSLEQYRTLTNKGSNLGIKTPDTSKLQPGDLVFFKTLKNNNPVTHVGVYAGNGEFYHASSGAKQVTKSNIMSSYYVKTFVGACRPNEFKNNVNALSFSSIAQATTNVQKENNNITNTNMQNSFSATKNTVTNLKASVNGRG